MPDCSWESLDDLRRAAVLFFCVYTQFFIHLIAQIERRCPSPGIERIVIINHCTPLMHILSHGTNITTT